MPSDPTELARRFSPSKNGGLKKGETELRVLVSTDVLAQGQNLQDACITVNFDLPWAIIRLIQRAGRVDRIGQKNDTILVSIPDSVFDKLSKFFEWYDWHLEPRGAEYYRQHPGAKEEISPDVLGYIFEKYINQKQMGAYYTKEDIRHESQEIHGQTD